MNVKAKKMLSLVLAFVMVLGMFPATVFATNEAGRFADVPADVWYADAVQYVADNGLMVGVDDNHFAPGGLTTRGMVVTVLHRMEGEPSAEGTGFTDVEDGVWYTEAILWAQENGIVEGYGDGTFHPHASMTREEMMAVFYRYSQYKGYDVSEAASLTVFTDSVKIQSYAEDAMAWAVSVGLIVGFEDGTIRPQADSNRVQLATVLMRFNNSFINKLSITITQDDCTVTEIHHSLGGEFHILNTALQEISCSAQSEEYPDNEYEIGNILIDESQRTWKIEDIRLYPGKNDITVTIVDIFGNQASDCITITYDSGSFVEYEESEIVYFDDESQGGYVNNTVIVIIDASVSDRNSIIEEVCNVSSGHVIGCLNGACMYQVRVDPRSYEELCALCDALVLIEGVSAANCEYIIPANDEIVELPDGDNTDSSTIHTVTQAEDDGITIPDDPWKDTFQGFWGQNWDEDKPSGLNWWTEAVRALSAWNYTDKMQSISIGIVDTGVDTQHEDLTISNSLNSNIKGDHGTHVAGIIGATANNKKGITGIVWNKRIMNYDAYQGGDSSSTILVGITELLEAGARVINDSNGTLLDESDVVDHGDQIAALVNNWSTSITDDFIIVQAAGNSSVDSRRNGHFAAVTDEKALEHIIIVAAADQPSNNTYKLTDFSNYGEGVTIAAPGKSIFSTIVTGGMDGDYGKMSGTSMAAPIVTGIVATIWSIDSNFTAAEVKQLLVNTATTEVSGYHDQGTYYLANAYEAVEEAIARTYDDGTAEGYFVNAATGAGLQVDFRIHEENAEGEVVYYGESNEDGSFWFEVPAGEYVIEAYGQNFISSFTPCTVRARTCKDLGTIPISTEVGENAYRIVLEWGVAPSDLDSHFVADSITGDSIHIFYSEKYSSYANLDIDITSSYGPETITVNDAAQLKGFTYSVHNYSNRSAQSGEDAAYYLSYSSAVVKVYKANSLIKTYEIPSGRAGTVWNVFSIDEQGNIKTLNTFEFISDPVYVGRPFGNDTDQNTSNVSGAHSSKEKES